MDSYGSLGEAYEYEKSADLETIKSKYDRQKFVSNASSERGTIRRTLRDEQVKSLEEVAIANFLFLNGINYEYERLYPFEAEDATKKAYRPDFYLPDYRILHHLLKHSKDAIIQDGKAVTYFSPYVLPSWLKSNWQLVFCEKLTAGLWMDGNLASKIIK